MDWLIFSSQYQNAGIREDNDDFLEGNLKNDLVFELSFIEPSENNSILYSIQITSQWMDIGTWR